MYFIHFFPQLSLFLCAHSHSSTGPKFPFSQYKLDTEDAYPLNPDSYSYDRESGYPSMEHIVFPNSQ